MESLDNVRSLVLIQQHHGHQLLKWPAQQSIVFPSHDGEEEGEVGFLTGTIAIQIQPQVNNRDYLVVSDKRVHLLFGRWFRSSPKGIETRGKTFLKNASSKD